MSLNKKKKPQKQTILRKLDTYQYFIISYLYVFTALLTCLHGNFACSFSFATADIKLAEF